MTSDHMSFGMEMVDTYYFESSLKLEGQKSHYLKRSLYKINIKYANIQNRIIQKQ